MHLMAYESPASSATQASDASSGTHGLPRRGFLKAAGVAAGATLAAPYVITSKALGDATTPPASDRIVMGGIGIGNMGTGDQNAFLGRSDVQYVAVCDVRKKWRDDSGVTCRSARSRRSNEFWSTSIVSSHRFTFGNPRSILRASFSSPATLVAIDSATGKTGQLSRFNDALLAKVEMGKVDSVSYRSANGADIQMWVVKPPRFDASKKYENPFEIDDEKN
jgi:hypothetical protein